MQNFLLSLHHHCLKKKYPIFFLRLYCFLIPIPLPRIPMGLCWHERSHTDAANKWLRSVFRRLFADY